MIPPSASTREKFDPAAWLGALAAIGGGYALTSERRLAFLVAGCDGEALATIMAHVVGRRDRQDALVRSIERHQGGER